MSTRIDVPDGPCARRDAALTVLAKTRHEIVESRGNSPAISTRAPACTCAQGSVNSDRLEPFRPRQGARMR